MIRSFESVARSDALLLILGTMPSVTSLAKHEYYGHKQNAFWRIMFTVFDTPYSGIWDEKCRLLTSHRVALWDVLASCEREGSQDSKIKNERPNDFDAFFASMSDIRFILFNGRRAEHDFKKYCRPHYDRLPHAAAPSTSPLCRKSFESKLALWRGAFIEAAVL